MNHIVLTTSSSGLENLNIKTNIQLIRLRIHVNNIEFIDGKNINNEGLDYLMNQKVVTPVKTAPPPLEEVIELFADLQAKRYKKVFITTLSSAMSDSYNIIKEAAHGFKDHMDIYVYDCKELNVCESFLALEAEYLMSKNTPTVDIVKRLNELRDNHKMLYAVDDLSYLIRNKKLSGTAGFFANLIDLKPVLTINEQGATLPNKKLRKLERAINYMVDELHDAMIDKDSFVYVLTAGRPEIDDHIVRLIKSKTTLKNIPILPVSAISLANHGPVGTGLCVFEGERPYAAKYYQS